MAYLDDRLFKDTFNEAEMANMRGQDRDDYIKYGLIAGAKKGVPEVRRNIKQLFDAGVILSAGTGRGGRSPFSVYPRALYSAGTPPPVLLMRAIPQSRHSPPRDTGSRSQPRPT